ncbi:MAG TPA: sialidase family protein [Woeseiaceae bacterium]|nr:sialidase family protein [Woeseiaceae bacterium]
MPRSLLLFVLASLALSACEKTPPPAFGDSQPLTVPAALDSTSPKLTAGSGQLLLSWIERQPGGATLKVAELGAESWGPAVSVATDAEMFVNWADLPGVLSLTRGAKANSHWVAHWLSHNADGPYAYSVRVSQSHDGGATWSEPMTPHTDGTATEHGFVAKYRAPQGVGLVWLDGRNTAEGGGMSLRSAVVAPDGSLMDEHLIDDLVCDCCPTHVAVSSGGPLLVYRDRSPDDVRDIYITRYSNGRWSPGVPVAADGWVIRGCPVNGPAIVASGDLVGVAWFTAAGDRPRVQLSISRDGGRTFPAPTEITSGNVAGYVDLVFAGQSTFVVSWADKEGKQQAIRLRSVKEDMTLGPATTVARSRLAMNMPQMEFRQGELVLAWTDIADDESRRIVSARIPVNPGR